MPFKPITQNNPIRNAIRLNAKLLRVVLSLLSEFDITNQNFGRSRTIAETDDQVVRIDYQGMASDQRVNIQVQVKSQTAGAVLIPLAYCLVESQADKAQVIECFRAAMEASLKSGQDGEARVYEITRT